MYSTRNELTERNSIRPKLKEGLFIKIFNKLTDKIICENYLYRPID